MRRAVEAGDGDECQRQRLIGAYLQALPDCGNGGGVGRIDENEMTQQGRGSDQLLRLALLAPQLGDRKRNGAAFQIANVNLIEFSPVTDDEAFAALGAAMQRHHPVVLVAGIVQDHRPPAVTRPGDGADKHGRLDLGVFQVRQMSAKGRRGEPLFRRKGLIV